MNRQNTLFSTFVHHVSRSILGMIGLSCYILADTFFISLGLGSTGLAALNLAIPVYSAISAFGIMAGMGSSTRYAILQGSGRADESRHAFTDSLLLILVIALLLVPLGLFASEPISLLLGADSATLADTTVYLQTLLICSPLFLLNQVLLFFLRSDGAPGLAMAGMLTGSFSNILLDWVFIFPFGMGMFGAVLATCMAPLLSILVMSRHLIKGPGFLPLSFSPAPLQGICRTCALGSSGGFCELAAGLVIILFNLLMLKLAGNDGVAAYGIVANLALVATAIFNGIAQGVQPLFAYQYGRKQEKELADTRRLCFGTALVLGVLLWIGVSLAAIPLAQLFNQQGDPQLTEMAAGGLRLYFSAFLFTGFNLSVAVFFTATDRAAGALLLSTLRGFILVIPLALILQLLGVTGIWLTVPAAELLTALTAIWMLRRCRTMGTT